MGAVCQPQYSLHGARVLQCSVLDAYDKRAVTIALPDVWCTPI